MDDIDVELFGDPNEVKHRGGNTQIAVYARIRPWFKKQHTTLQQNAVDYTVDNTVNTLSLRIPSTLSKDYINNSKEIYDYKFAGILNEKCTQDDVFQTIGKPAIDNVLNGYNSTIFAYGQTGSGKTYTITGGSNKYDDRGIIPRTLAYIYDTIEKHRNEKIYNVKISYLEIYNENGYDLLHPEHDSKSIDDLPKVSIYENSAGEFIPTNIYAFPADNLEDALNLLFVGDTNRVVCETPSNDASTRSHCIFTIQIESRDITGNTIRKSKLNLVDLAGSERIKKTGVSGKIEREARYINLSLHYLEQLIIALHHASQQQRHNHSVDSDDSDSVSTASGSGGKHIHLPYRNSMMTMMLRDSLGGNCKTIMIATFSMAYQHIEETISTARFSQRVAMIRNYVYVNETIDPQLMISKLKHKIREQQEEIQMLRGQYNSDGNNELTRSVTDEERIRLKELIQKFLQQQASNGNDMNDEKYVKLHTLARYKVAACFDMLKQLLLITSSKQQNSDKGNSKQLLLNGADGENSDANKENGGKENNTIELNVHKLLGSGGGGGVATVNAVSSSGNNGTLDYNNTAAADEIKKLRMLVHHRDKEISVLVSMLKNYEAGNIHNAGNVGAPDSRVYSNATDPMLLAKQQQLLQTLQSPSSAAVAASSQSQQPHSQPPEAPINNELLKQRAEAFEIFRKSYRKNEVIEENKASLAIKYDAAKKLGESINTARNNINHLKALLEQRRIEIGVQRQLLDGNANDCSNNDDKEEQRIRHQMEAEKTTYRDKFQELKALKAEIEHDQQLLERSRRKLQQEFDAWWKENQSIARQMNGSLPDTNAQQQPTDRTQQHMQPQQRPPSASASSVSNRMVNSRPPSASHSATTSSDRLSQTRQPLQQQATQSSNAPPQRFTSQSFTPAPLYPLSRSGSQKSITSSSSTSAYSPPQFTSPSPLSVRQSSLSPSPTHAAPVMQRANSNSMNTRNDGMQQAQTHNAAAPPAVIQTSTHVLPSTGNAQADADIAAFYRMRDALLASHQRNNNAAANTQIT